MIKRKRFRDPLQVVGFSVTQFIIAGMGFVWFLNAFWLEIVFIPFAMFFIAQGLFFLMCGGVMFRDDKVRITNYYRMYSFRPQDIEKFYLSEPQMSLDAGTSPCILKFKDDGKEKSLNVRSIRSPSKKRKPEKYARVHAMVDEMNTELQKLQEAKRSTTTVTIGS